MAACVLFGAPLPDQVSDLAQVRGSDDGSVQSPNSLKLDSGARIRPHGLRSCPWGDLDVQNPNLSSEIAKSEPQIQKLRKTKN